MTLFSLLKNVSFSLLKRLISATASHHSRAHLIEKYYHKTQQDVKSLMQKRRYTDIFGRIQTAFTIIDLCDLPRHKRVIDLSFQFYDISTKLKKTKDIALAEESIQELLRHYWDGYAKDKSEKSLDYVFQIHEFIKSKFLKKISSSTRELHYLLDNFKKAKHTQKLVDEKITTPITSQKLIENARPKTQPTPSVIRDTLWHWGWYLMYRTQNSVHHVYDYAAHFMNLAYYHVRGVIFTAEELYDFYYFMEIENGNKFQKLSLEKSNLAKKENLNAKAIEAFKNAELMAQFVAPSSFTIYQKTYSEFFAIDKQCAILPVKSHALRIAAKKALSLSEQLYLLSPQHEIDRNIVSHANYLKALHSDSNQSESNIYQEERDIISQRLQKRLKQLFVMLYDIQPFFDRFHQTTYFLKKLRRISSIFVIHDSFFPEDFSHHKTIKNITDEIKKSENERENESPTANPYQFCPHLYAKRALAYARINHPTKAADDLTIAIFLAHARNFTSKENIFLETLQYHWQRCLIYREQQDARSQKDLTIVLQMIQSRLEHHLHVPIKMEGRKLNLTLQDCTFTFSSQCFEKLFQEDLIQLMDDCKNAHENYHQQPAETKSEPKEEKLAVAIAKQDTDNLLDETELKRSAAYRDAQLEIERQTREQQKEKIRENKVPDSKIQLEMQPSTTRVEKPKISSPKRNNKTAKQKPLRTISQPVPLRAETKSILDIQKAKEQKEVEKAKRLASTLAEKQAELRKLRTAEITAENTQAMQLAKLRDAVKILKKLEKQRNSAERLRLDREQLERTRLQDAAREKQNQDLLLQIAEQKRVETHLAEEKKPVKIIEEKLIEQKPAQDKNFILINNLEKHELPDGRALYPWECNYYFSLIEKFAKNKITIIHGGLPRDRLLKRLSKNLDIDMKTTATADELKSAFPETDFSHEIHGDTSGKIKSIIIRPLRPEIRDWLPPCQITLKEDLSDLRQEAQNGDFTINTIKWIMCNTKELNIDSRMCSPLPEAYRDLVAKIIRVVPIDPQEKEKDETRSDAEISFTKDPSRILRGLKLFYKLKDFTIEAATFAGMKSCAHLVLTKLTIELIHDLLDKIIRYGDNENKFAMILEVFPRDRFPQISALLAAKVAIANEKLPKEKPAPQEFFQGAPRLHIATSSPSPKLSHSPVG